MKKLDVLLGLTRPDPKDPIHRMIRRRGRDWKRWHPFDGNDWVHPEKTAPDIIAAEIQKLVRAHEMEMANANGLSERKEEELARKHQALAYAALDRIKALLNGLERRAFAGDYEQAARERSTLSGQPRKAKAARAARKRNRRA